MDRECQVGILKTIGSIVNPNDVNLHPMLPSIAIADITDEDAGKEIIVPQPAATDGGDSQLWYILGRRIC